MESHNVRELLKDLVDISTAKEIKSDGETISYWDLQELYGNKISELVELLGMMDLYDDKEKNSPCANKERTEINIDLYGERFTSVVDQISHKELPEK